MNSIKTILVAVDFSTGSRSAVEHGTRLAIEVGAKLHLLHVVDSEALAAHAALQEGLYEELAKSSAEGAGRAFSQWLGPIKLPQDHEVTIAVGVPLHEILEHVKSYHADLLVAGITGSGWALSGAGSVSAKLARKSPCNVLLVRADRHEAFRKVVACIDFSENAREVKAQACQFASSENSSLHFLHVWQEPLGAMPYALPFDGFGSEMAVATPEQKNAMAECLRKELTEFVAGVAQIASVTCALHEASNVGRGIADYAGNTGADLIVVGIKGRTNLKYVLMGSVAERLLGLLPCSVLVVKPMVTGS